MQRRGLFRVYKTESVDKIIEGKKTRLYGITDGKSISIDFTTDETVANKFADLMNENGVEPCHIPEIIEDFFYSCEDKNRTLFSKTEL